MLHVHAFSPLCSVFFLSVCFVQINYVKETTNLNVCFMHRCKNPNEFRPLFSKRDVFSHYRKSKHLLKTK